MELNQIENSFLEAVAQQIGIPSLQLGRTRTSVSGFYEVTSYWLVTLVAKKYSCPQLIVGVASTTEKRVFLSCKENMEIGCSKSLADLEAALMNPSLSCPASFLPDSLGPNEYELCSVIFKNWFCSGRFAILGTAACQSSTIVSCVESLIFLETAGQSTLPKQ